MSSDLSSSAGQLQTSRIRHDILEKNADVPLRRIEADDVCLTEPAVRSTEIGGHALDRSRAALAKIDFLPPEAIPAPAALRRGLSDETRRLCREALGLSAPALDTARLALAALSRSIPPKSRRALEAVIAADALSDGDVHDGFFNIRRASKPSPVVYVRSMLETLLVFRQDLNETAVTIDPPKLAAIETGLLTILSLGLGEGIRRSVGLFPTASASAFDDHAARRWIRGHQIFAALSQGLIFAMERLDEAMTGEGSHEDAVALVVIGLDASAAALEFTGDFPEGMYEERIRPSMCPPYMPRGFSGLLSVDHTELVRRMRQMKTAMQNLRTRHPEGHADIVAALSHVYDRHKHVCMKFVGTERTSLLMAGETTRSSVDQLERFKAMRIRNLG